MSTQVTSANLTNSTSSTPTSSDNSNSLINSAWAKLGFAISLLPNGYIKLPNWMSGLVIEWGHVTTDIDGGTVGVSFPLTFPNNAFVVIPVTLSPTDRITYVVNGSLSQSGFTVGNNGSSGFAYYLAIGN